jgi:hypothetical protein
MFPDNPEINEMINLLKSNREDGQTSEIRSSRIGLKQATVKSDSMPKIENKVAQRKSEEKSN